MVTQLREPFVELAPTVLIRRAFSARFSCVQPWATVLSNASRVSGLAE